MGIWRPLNILLFIFALSLSCLDVAQAKLSLVQEVDTDVWRGSQPKTQVDFDKLKEMGVKVIVNIQRLGDKLVEPEQVLAEANGIQFIHIPVNALERPDDETIEKIFTELLNKANHPIYLHCTLGRDRTGLIFALYRVRIQKMSPAEAYKEWQSFGFSPKFLKKLDAYFKEKMAFTDAKKGCPTALAGIPAA